MSASVDEKQTMQSQLLELVKLCYRFEHSGTLEDFNKETNDHVLPTMEFFPFNEEERKIAQKFKNELIMCHIQKLPRDILDTLIFHLSSGPCRHIYNHNLYMQNDLTDYKWDHKAAQKVIETWDDETLQTKINEQTKELEKNLIIYHHSWNADSEELKPYIKVIYYAASIRNLPVSEKDSEGDE